MTDKPKFFRPEKTVAKTIQKDKQRGLIRAKASTFARAQILGFVNKDPELLFTKRGIPAAVFSVVTFKRWKEPGDEHKASFHKIRAWGNLALYAAQYVSRGRYVMVEGRYVQTEWDWKRKRPAYGIFVKAAVIHLCDTVRAAPMRDPFRDPDPALVKTSIYEVVDDP